MKFAVGDKVQQAPNKGGIYYYQGMGNKVGTVEQVSPEYIHPYTVSFGYRFGELDTGWLFFEHELEAAE